jgi:hypothetical protein
MKRQSTRLLFILLIVTSCQEQNIGLKKEKLSKIAYTSLDKEPMLNQAHSEYLNCYSWYNLFHNINLD